MGDSELLDVADDIVAGFDAGGDEYITKPLDHAALVARVRSILRIKALHDRVQERAAELEEWNRTLEQRVREQVAELDRMRQIGKAFDITTRAKLFTEEAK